MLLKHFFEVSLDSDKISLRLTVGDVPRQLAKFVIGNDTSLDRFSIIE